MINSNNKQGFAALLITFLIMGASFGIAAVALSLTTREGKILKSAAHSEQSFYAAESGLEDAIYRIIKKKPYASSYEFTVGGATTTVSVSGANEKTIASQSNFNNIFRILRSVLSLEAVNPQFFYGAQAGEGGVEMSQNSRIEGVGGSAGNFYSNGPVKGESGATATGDVIVATGISLSEQSTVCDSDEIVGQSNPRIDFAQSFRAAQSKPLTKVGLYIKKVGSPGSRTIKITNDTSGSPAQSALASADLEAGLVGTDYSWVDIVFGSPANLTAGNTYWIVLDADQNSSKYWKWCKDSAAGYFNGSAKYSQDWDNEPWTQISGDLTFKTYLGTGLSSIDGLAVYGTVKANSITNSKICGDAYYKSAQDIDSSSKNFLDNPSNPTCPNPLTTGTGYPNQPDPPVSPLPISQANIDQWKADAASGGVISGDYSVSNNVSLGPKEISGNLLMNSNNKTLTVAGTIYVRGNIDISNGSSIRCSSDYGSNSCVIVADGWIHITNNGVFSGSGQAGSYLMLLTTLSGCTGIDGQTGCTHHNGGIDLHNNASGAVFYAQNSMINLHNGVQVSELTAYKIRLDNNAVVRYEQGLMNANFTSGPGASYKIKSWEEAE